MKEEPPSGPTALDRALGASGVAAPTVFALAVLIAGSLHPNYSHISQAISELGAKGAPYRDVLNYGGLVPAGALTFVFSIAMFRQGRRGVASSASAGLVALMGLGRFLAGIFSCDPGCSTMSSTSASLHVITASVALVAGAAAPLVMAFGLRARYSGMPFILSLALGLGALVALLAGISRIWMPYLGAIQRLLLTFTYAWVIAVALNLGALDHGKSSIQRLPQRR